MQIACRGPEGGPQKGQQGEEGDGASKIPQNATRRPRLRGLNARIGRAARASAAPASLPVSGSSGEASDGGGATDLGSHSRSQICSRVASRPGSCLRAPGYWAAKLDATPHPDPEAAHSACAFDTLVTCTACHRSVTRSPLAGSFTGLHRLLGSTTIHASSLVTQISGTGDAEWPRWHTGRRTPCCGAGTDAWRPYPRYSLHG